MSYNIDSVTVIKSEGFSIAKATWLELCAEHEDGEDLAEGNFLDGSWLKYCCTEDADGILHVIRIWWHGEFSGDTEPTLRELLAKFSGSADLLLTWGEGDSFSGLRLENGKVTEHEVEHSLGKAV